MTDAALDKFGRLVVNQLRDKAIDHFDALAAKQYKAPSLAKLQVDLGSLNAQQQAIVRRCVISAVDVGLHDFLFGLVESHDFSGGVVVLSDGKNVVELSDGLHGEQFTDDGWIARFGKHPELVEPESTPEPAEDKHAWRDKREDAAACPQCGKPLRTAQAKQCFQCGANWR
ncbi:MAG: hypothetical protein KDA41_03675 [Planctomycetales bacterium]|nr:hypothetical protein [Planctomycetales bacterium]